MLALAAFIPLVFFLALWVFVIRKRGLEYKALAESGVEVMATVTQKKTYKSGSKRRAPGFVYEFADPYGFTQRRRVFVMQKVYDTVVEGGPIAVVYLPEKPSVNALKSDIELAKQALATKNERP